MGGKERVMGGEEEGDGAKETIPT